MSKLLNFFKFLQEKEDVTLPSSLQAKFMKPGESFNKSEDRPHISLSPTKNLSLKQGSLTYNALENLPPGVTVPGHLIIKPYNHKADVVLPKDLNVTGFLELSEVDNVSFNVKPGVKCNVLSIYPQHNNYAGIENMQANFFMCKLENLLDDKRYTLDKLPQNTSTVTVTQNGTSMHFTSLYLDVPFEGELELKGSIRGRFDDKPYTFKTLTVSSMADIRIHPDCKVGVLELNQHAKLLTPQYEWFEIVGKSIEGPFGKQEPDPSQKLTTEEIIYCLKLEYKNIGEIRIKE